MTALMARRGFEVDAIDVFCGYGGSSQGIHAAGATVRAAANHNQLSIDCHARNFPDTEHWVADLVDPAAKHYVDPADLPQARFAWFSPSCTHHSQANAKKVYARGLRTAMFEDDEWDDQAYVNSERSRVTMSCVLRYCDRNRPELLVVENVIEVTKWGPNRDGATYDWWLRELHLLGYETRECFFNSMFFPPCPQSRDRIYIVAWRAGNTPPDLDYRPRAFCTSDRCGGRHVDAVQTFKRSTAAWMGRTRWGKYGAQYDYRCPHCLHPVHPASWMALSAIDWSNLGPTLAERDKPLAPATVERIRRALRKYWYAPPVMLPTPAVAASVSMAMQHSPAKYASNRSRHVSEHLPTLSQRNAEGVATLPLFVKNNGSIDEARYRGHHLGEPLGSITTESPQAVVIVPNRTNATGRHAGEEVPTLVTAGSLQMVATVAAAGNTYESGDYTRTRHASEQLFTQHTTDAFAVAALPVLRGSHAQEGHVGEPTPTITTGRKVAGSDQGGLQVALATFSKINGGPGDTAWHHPTEPLNTVTARDTHGLVLLPWIDQWRTDPALITEQLATVTTHLRHSLASIEPFEGEITEHMLGQVRFRMLDPDPELRRAMAFGDDYILLGNKGQQTSGLGNAVTPPVATWLTNQCLATLRGAEAAA